MKIRLGFVSNSSSSSYVCNICREKICGYDVSVSDGDMFNCENNHVICESHLKSKSIREDICSKSKEEFLKILDPEEHDEAIELIEEYGLKDGIREYYDRGDGFNYEVPAVHCPICQMTAFDGDELARYLFKIYHISRKKLIKDIQHKFKNYDEYKQFIKEVKLL